ncbi:MAG: hypothetical protein ABI606_06630 [Rhodoferax sp.]
MTLEWRYTLDDLDWQALSDRWQSDCVDTAGSLQRSKEDRPVCMTAAMAIFVNPTQALESGLVSEDSADVQAQASKNQEFTL